VNGSPSAAMKVSEMPNSLDTSPARRHMSSAAWLKAWCRAATRSAPPGPAVASDATGAT
jgi:hypothetical protein